jgi:ubiquinone biosynthesis monooxygenase Coq7
MTRQRRLPGDPSSDQSIEQMIRVDQAGEYGARRIYEGQLAVLPQGPGRAAVEHMAAQERRHLEAFDRMVGDRHVRPTALQPLWHAAGFALGAATALLGSRAAMACTVAVEEVIDAHYARQAAALPETEGELRTTIEKFRGEELEHRDLALAHGAGEAPGYELLTSAIKAGSRLAIWLAERI